MIGTQSLSAIMALVTAGRGPSNPRQPARRQAATRASARNRPPGLDPRTDRRDRAFRRPMVNLPSFRQLEHLVLLADHGHFRPRGENRPRDSVNLERQHKGIGKYSSGVIARPPL
jgi:hypothetical protein